MVLREELLDAQQPSTKDNESNMDDLEFLSAHEAFSQEQNDIGANKWEESQAPSVAPSSPFQSSCSPIRTNASEKQPAASGGSVRAMVQAMEQRRQEQQLQSPNRPPTVKTTSPLKVASPNKNVPQSLVESTVDDEEPSTATATDSSSSTNNTSVVAESDPASKATTDVADADHDNTNAGESTIEPHDCDDDNDDFWANEIIAENDSDLYDERLAEEELMQEENETMNDVEDQPMAQSLRLEETQEPQGNDEVEKELDNSDASSSTQLAPLRVTTNTVDSSTPSKAAGLLPGSTVQVQARTWPGINQPGGVATILKTHDSKAGSMSYDVQYVLDRRKEKNVETKYISRFNEDDAVSEGRRRQSPRAAKAPPTPIATKVEHSTNSKPSTAVKPRSNLKKPPSRLKKRKSNDAAEPSKRQKSPKFVAKINAKLAEMTHEELCTKASLLYQQRIRSAMKKGVIYVCASNLTDADERALKELARIVKESKGTLRGVASLLYLTHLIAVRIVQQGNIQANKTTMCLVPVSVPSSHQRNNVMPVLRTMKAMQAAVLGIPLVNTAWIYNCKRAKSLQEPDACLYIRSLPTKRTDDVADFGVSLLAAARLSSSPKHSTYSPFAGLGFYFCGFKQKDEANFQELLRAAGIDSILNKQALLSHVQAQDKRENHQLVIVCGDAATISFPKVVCEALESNDSSSAIVATQWLVDSVSAGRALAISDYPPTSSKARTLWEASKGKPLLLH